jgi:hypothetical protein
MNGKTLATNRRNTMIRTTKFQETTTSAATFESAGKITITVIKPGMSKNKRYYPASVLRNSVAVFKNAKMFTEHSNQNGVKEWVGCLDVAWAESDGTIKGAGQIIDPMFKKKLELLAGAGKLGQMGVSISCSGTAIDGEEDGIVCKIVESLDACQSVDFVARPAAGGRVDAIESVQQSTQDRLRSAFEKILPPAEAALAARGPMANGSEIDVQFRGRALLDRMDLLELE